jgi:serine/threonine-protein phosphatase 4 regulatory subunit 1
VRLASGVALVALARLIRPKDMGPRVLTFGLQLAHEDDHEDRRITAAMLLNELAPVLGQELCNQFVTPEIISLSEDPVFRVRKATALNLDNVCKCVGGRRTVTLCSVVYCTSSPSRL